MVWKSRVSIRDDLVRLHESSRAADMSRDLGYSSISMGEGSLDLIVGDNPDDKRVVLGDQADGRFGISLWHRGGLKYVPDVLTDAEDRISATEQKNGTQDHRLDAITTLAEASRDRLDGHDSTLASHDTRIGNAQSRADSAWTRAGTGIADASTAQSRADAAWTRAGNAQSAADSAASAASTAAARATKIINCINGIIPAGANLSSGGVSTMATASEWQQLKDCINS